MNDSTLRVYARGYLNLVAVLVGAAIGAAVNAAIEVGTSVITKQKIDWVEVGGAAVAGAITGGLAGATGGTSLLVKGIGGTLIDSAVKNVVAEGISSVSIKKAYDRKK